MRFSNSNRVTSIDGAYPSRLKRGGARRHVGRCSWAVLKIFR